MNKESLLIICILGATLIVAIACIVQVIKINRINWTDVPKKSSERPKTKPHNRINGVKSD